MSTAKTYDKRLAKWWQKVLGLEDWDIDVEYMSRQKFSDIFGLSKAGHSECTLTRKWATVAVNLNSEDKTDPEQTLVHEEFHVLSNDLWNGILRILDNFVHDKQTWDCLKDEMASKLEVLTDATATALVRLKHMGERKKVAK